MNLLAPARQILVRSGVLMVLLLAAGCSSEGPTSAPIPRRFVARAEIIDSAAERVVWRASCGPSNGDQFTTAVSSATFEVESNLDDPARGHVRAVTFDEWVAYADTDQWVVASTEGTTQSVRSYGAPSDRDACSP